MCLSYSAALNVLLRVSIILPQTLPFLRVKRPEPEADQPPTYRLGLRVRPHSVAHSYALEHPEQWPAYNLRLVLKACSINSSCYSYTIHYTVYIEFSPPVPRFNRRASRLRCLTENVAVQEHEFDSVCSRKFRREGDQTRPSRASSICV